MHSLLWRQYFAGNAGAVFVHAVKLPVAVVALDVALWSYREMNTPERMPGRIIETGVVFYFHIYNRLIAVCFSLDRFNIDADDGSMNQIRLRVLKFFIRKPPDNQIEHLDLFSFIFYK